LRELKSLGELSLPVLASLKLRNPTTADLGMLQHCLDAAAVLTLKAIELGKPQLNCLKPFGVGLQVAKRASKLRGEVIDLDSQHTGTLRYGVKSTITIGSPLKRGGRSVGGGQRPWLEVSSIEALRRLP